MGHHGPPGDHTARPAGGDRPHVPPVHRRSLRSPDDEVVGYVCALAPESMDPSQTRSSLQATLGATPKNSVAHGPSKHRGQATPMFRGHKKPYHDVRKRSNFSYFDLYSGAHNPAQPSRRTTPWISPFLPVLHSAPYPSTLYHQPESSIWCGRRHVPLRRRSSQRDTSDGRHRPAASLGRSATSAADHGRPSGTGKWWRRRG